MSKLKQRSVPGVWLASLGDAAQVETREAGFSRKEFSSTAVVSAECMRVLRLLGEPSHSLPASAERASCSVIFDGVLYNRDELSDRFTGSSASTANDADLVLQAYLCWGEDVLCKIKGIFALLIWDSTHDILLCARDPMGIYPLFYADAGRDLLLSTSIDALVQHPRVSSAVNRAALADHLCHRWPKLEETYFAAVNRVPPGHAMRVGSGERRVYRYWDPAPPGTSINWIGEDELERFDLLLDQAVNRCLELGSTGIFLSGGLDSVSVAGVAVDNCRRKGLSLPRALSLAFPNPECNEEVTQKGVAANLGLPQALVSLNEALGSKGLLLSALEVSSSWPAPLLNCWLPAYHYLGLEGKRRGCQVILTGSGGDEWLCVSPLLAADLIRDLDVGGLYQLWDTMQRSYKIPRLTMMRSLLWTFGVRPLLGAAARIVLHSSAPWVLQARRRWRISKSTPDWVAPDPVLRREIDQRAEQNTPAPELGGFYLREVRRELDHPVMAMEMEEYFESGKRLGLRLLHPFWDAELVDLLYRIPPQLLNKGGRSKGLVRQSLARRFPNLGFERQKKVTAMNFFKSVILREWEGACQMLGGTPALGKLGIVDETVLRATIEKILSDKQPRDVYRIWDILNLEAWLQSHL